MPATRIFSSCAGWRAAVSLRIDRLNFFGREEKTMAGLAQHAKILAGIVIQHDGEMHLAFVILLNRFDDGDLAGQSEIEDVAAFAGTQTDQISFSYLDTSPETVMLSTGETSSRSCHSHSFMAVCS